jgi:NADPH-dependent glutamate synthase beta subunit-like oxidoreductase/NAD(P)H-flavin reductase
MLPIVDLSDPLLADDIRPVVRKVLRGRCWVTHLRSRDGRGMRHRCYQKAPRPSEAPANRERIGSISVPTNQDGSMHTSSSRSSDRLAFGFSFAELAKRPGLIRLDRLFLERLAADNPDLHRNLLAGRADPEHLAPKEESELIIEVARYLDTFVAELFDVVDYAQSIARRTHELDPVHACKRAFVQRFAVKKYPDPTNFDGQELRRELEARLQAKLTDRRFAAAVATWERDCDSDALDIAARYAAWATLTDSGLATHPDSTLFRVPHRVDPKHLIALETIERDGVTIMRLAEDHWRTRYGFALTDQGMNDQQALDQMNYCIWCHKQGKDSCSKGLRDRKTGAFQKSSLGITLAGCPLDEKISEMHSLRAEGYPIGAFATIAIDNPMMAATGHRICNDCMKACIYQKQDPVDIPQAETSILREVLALPWGFEIYALLTRWNPLDLRRPLPRPSTGRNVLVVGLGPAGFTLAHHLINEGHAVVAVDGLKIEPLGFDPKTPVRDCDSLFEDLDDRVMAGFGGVAEYGITVRWNKNYLKLVRLLLERNDQFAMFGGIRFGGGATLSIDDVWSWGFDHIALCLGAGRPTFVDIPNGLARGVRQASDFLMALQLTGAAKLASVANLQLRLPVVVVGGGLTAIDTATESLAYYVRQVEKFALRYRILVRERGEAAVRFAWSDEERSIADEFLEHAEAISSERNAASKTASKPKVTQLLDSWGGVTIAYRRNLIDSPSYTLNHEEVAKAFEEGIRFTEGLAPLAVEIDQFGHACALRCTRVDGSEVSLPARTVLVAAGTQPNTVLAREDNRIRLDGRYFQAIDERGVPVLPERGISKPPESRVLMHRAENGRFISFFGDLHPSFSGNVVKAMGSARRGYPIVSRVLAERGTASVAPSSLISRCCYELTPKVHAVQRLTPTIVEIVIHAPAAARAFRPGQFFRLQNYEARATRLNEGKTSTLLGMEGLAMTGAWTDPARGLVSVIVLEMGGSSDLCSLLRPGEPVVLMGPTGTPTNIVPNSTVALVGGGLGNAVLFSIGAALRAARSRVVYFAGYKRIEDRYKVAEIERAADVIVWCCDEAPGFKRCRPQDYSFVGNIVQGLAAYGAGRLGDTPIPLSAAEHMIVIGSDLMMQAVAIARRGLLAPYLNPVHTAVGSINSPMQCMMKEVCAQCLQPHFDPETGTRSVVFSCFNQDQLLDQVDFSALHDRLYQNSLQEKLTAQWIDRSLRQMQFRQSLNPSSITAYNGK